ncbi:MAG: hypothetical protein HFG27_11230 [Provencibacterium sp.]|jgi:hypothetical protein|nr:hypothetical protein [Provencibacterium sp.]
MDNSFETIVLGASMVGLGYACAHPQSLVLEPGELLAPEFTAAFRPITGPVCMQDSPLIQSLLGAGVLSDDGALDPLAFSAGLFRFAREQRLPVLMPARPVSVRPAPQGGYLVEFLTSSGLRRKHAWYLLDTRPKEVCRKSLNLLCHDAVPDMAERLCGAFPLGAESLPGGVEGESILRIFFSPEDSLRAARQSIIRGWRQAFPGGGPHITAIAFDFDYIPEPGGSLQGAAFSDPADAFLCGSRLLPASLPDFACEKEDAL